MGVNKSPAEIFPRKSKERPQEVFGILQGLRPVSS